MTPNTKHFTIFAASIVVLAILFASISLYRTWRDSDSIISSPVYVDKVLPEASKAVVSRVSLPNDPVLANDNSSSFHPQPVSNTIQTDPLGPKMMPTPRELSDQAISESSQSIHSSGFAGIEHGHMSTLSSFSAQVTSGNVVLSAVPASPSIPAVYANPGGFSSLPKNQQELNAEIANQFNSDVQASSAPPSSPEYMKAWNAAVWRADQSIEAQIGVDAYNRLQESQ